MGNEERIEHGDKDEMREVTEAIPRTSEHLVKDLKRSLEERWILSARFVEGIVRDVDAIQAKAYEEGYAAGRKPIAIHKLQPDSELDAKFAEMREDIAKKVKDLFSIPPSATSTGSFHKDMERLSEKIIFLLEQEFSQRWAIKCGPRVELFHNNIVTDSGKKQLQEIASKNGAKLEFEHSVPSMDQMIIPSAVEPPKIERDRSFDHSDGDTVKASSPAMAIITPPIKAVLPPKLADVFEEDDGRPKKKKAKKK